MIIFTSLAWIGASLLAAALAHDRGYNAAAWLVGSLVFSPLLVFIALAFAPNLRREAIEQARHEEIAALLRASMPESALGLLPSLPEPEPRPGLIERLGVRPALAMLAFAAIVYVLLVHFGMI